VTLYSAKFFAKEGCGGVAEKRKQNFTVVFYRGIPHSFY